jgi:uracil-DNA glycosylase
MVADYDPGPPRALLKHFADVPSYEAHRELFWLDWGPIFYRGRLDRSAHLIGIASDPGATERIAGRTLVGDAGQRVQGFLAKLGLTRSYVLVNAHVYGLMPSRAAEATPLLADKAHLAWRNTLLDRVVGPSLQAIVAFGQQAHVAVRLWDPRPEVPVLELPHPSSHRPQVLATAWRDAVTRLREIVTPDSDGDPTGVNYGTTIRESDYARVPAGDLPFGLPAWVGDDSWVRHQTPEHPSSVTRPRDDILHTIAWRAPTLPLPPPR